MMKIKKNSNNNKKKLLIILFLCGAIIIVAGATLLYLFNTHQNTDEKPQTDDTSDQITQPATNEQKESGESIKEQSVGSPSKIQPEDQSPDKSPVDVEITAANQNQSAGIYQIRSLIHSVQSTGTCTLTLTRGGASIQKQATIQALPSASTCQGFDIPLTEFAPGEWQLELIFENTAMIGKATRTITIQ